VLWALFSIVYSSFVHASTVYVLQIWCHIYLSFFVFVSLLFLCIVLLYFVPVFIHILAPVFYSFFLLISEKSFLKAELSSLHPSGLSIEIHLRQAFIDLHTHFTSSL